MDFEKAMSIYALREFGNLGHLIELGRYWDPPEIEMPNRDDFNEYEDPFGLRRADLLEQVKARRRLIEDMKAKRASFFAALYGQLSPESEEKVKQCESWELTDAAKDPLGLWRCIKETHILAQTGSNERDRMNVRKHYSSIKQEPSELLIRFKERYDNALSAMEAVDQELPGPIDQGIDFIDKLDNDRYSNFKIQLENNQLMNIGRFPESLLDAYLLASKFKVAPKIKETIVASPVVFATIDDASASSIQGRPV